MPHAGTRTLRIAGGAVLRSVAALLAMVAVLAGLGGCSSFAHFNERLDAPQPPPSRASFRVDGQRGNPRALVFLALSGGGSRSAYLATSAISRLSTVYPDFDFMAEVDAISAVSGGSLAGAFYAATRDDRLLSRGLAAQLRAALPAADLAPLAVEGEDAVRCAAAGEGELQALESRLAGRLAPPDLARLRDLCRQATLAGLRVWSDDDARTRMRRNYLARWAGNSLWPLNVAKYWFTAFDRSDIMAQTLADNLFDSPLVGHDLTLGDLNPTRPYLLVNATTASGQRLPDGSDDEFPFGSVFSFTTEEFHARLRSDINRYSLSRAVMASSAFPLVFANMTLRDFRDPRPEAEPRYLHVFDGGNADNLGLRAVKRALLTLRADDDRLQQYDRIVVILVDAFTRPSGARRDKADPRGLLSLFVDTNLTDAVDSLLMHNRTNLMDEFLDARLTWDNGDCLKLTRQLPVALCERLQRELPADELDLGDKLVVYHFGFEDVETVAGFKAGPGTPPAQLKQRLDEIPTSLMIGEEAVAAIDEAVDLVLNPGNGCLLQLRRLLQAETAGPADVRATRLACRRQEGEHPQQPPPRRRR